MFNLKKNISTLLILIFCVSLCFENYALTNLDLSGVKNSSYSNAPSGAEFYSFKNKGDTAKISTNRDLNKCTLRFYYINKNQKNDAKVVIYRYEKGKRVRWKIINMKKNKMDLKDFDTGNKSSSYYEIVLEKGSDVDIAVTMFDFTDKTLNEHRDKKYK